MIVLRNPCILIFFATCAKDKWLQITFGFFDWYDEKNTEKNNYDYQIITTVPPPILPTPASFFAQILWTEYVWETQDYTHRSHQIHTKIKIRLILKTWKTNAH
jgi:hypothetical protein